MLQTPPPIIALCGPPQHGKTTAQTILQEKLGVQPRDDGRPLRLEAMHRFDLTWDQVSTNAGKRELVEAYGRKMEVREVVGLVGKEWEKEDPLAVPKRALALLREEGDGSPVSFGSVRRGQGKTFRGVGALILEIYDPRKPQPVHDFDHYDPRYVHYTIVNDGTLDDLIKRLTAVAFGYINNHQAVSWDRPERYAEIAAALGSELDGLV